MKLAEICVRHPVFTVMLIAFLVTLGLFSYRDLAVDLFPKADPATVNVEVRLPGATPEEMVTGIVLPLEDAIRKMTSRPAARVGLLDRGLLRPGMAADVTVFDPATIHDVATFEDPNHYSVGVQYVSVNGTLVVSDGRITSARPGRPLRGPGYRVH